MLHANFMVLCFAEPELLPSKVLGYIAGTGIFDLSCSYDLDLDPMTFMYELYPQSLRFKQKLNGCMNFLRQCFRKLLSDR